MTANRVAAVVIALLLAGLHFDCQPARAAEYHIDFEKGDDTFDGLSPARAWRHAPGDQNATGRPATLTLRPGDSLLFAPGVRYRGAIKLNGGGNMHRPVVVTSAPGPVPAIIDGSDPVQSLRPCRSAEDCGGSPIWQKLVRAEFGSALPINAGLFTDAGPLHVAQAPVPADPFNSDNTAEYLSGDEADLRRGIAPLPAALARVLASPGDVHVVLHVAGNEIRMRRIVAVEGETIRFDPDGLRFHPGRPVRFAVLAHPLLVQRAGEYGLLAGGAAAIIYMPPNARTVSLSTGRSGINVTSQSYVHIRRLIFENMAADGVAPYSGVAIFKSSSGSDITVEDNHFRNFRMPGGNGPLALNFITRLSILNNNIQTIAFGSGMRLYKGVDVKIVGNTISQIGRTGIMLIDMQNAEISRNTILNARGIHGNGLSAYRDNHNIRIRSNTIAAAVRPVTIGHASSVPDNALIFERNLFVGTADSVAAFTSWGNSRGVTLSGNMLLGGKTGLFLNASDTSLVVNGNVMNGEPVVRHLPNRNRNAAGYIPAGWRIDGNRQVAYSVDRRATDAMSELGADVADAVNGGRTGAWRRLCELLPAGARNANTSGLEIGAKLDCAAPQ